MAQVVVQVLVTGAAGFIGRGLCRELAARGHHVTAGLRRAGLPAGLRTERIRPHVLGEVGPWRERAEALPRADIVVHLAQRAHSRATEAELAGEPAAAAGLLRAAARSDAGRFLYLSSIKAMGECTPPGRPFRAGDPARPEDAYGRVKLATEEALAEAAAETGTELVIVRAPLVYGAAAGGNFRRLARLAGRVPLPLAAVENRRSLIARDNLVDLLALAAVHPAAAGLWLARDGEDWSSAALVRLLARGQERPARLFALPAAVLAAAARLPGLGPAVCRLTQSLQVDDTATRAALQWTPPVAAEAALLAAARALAGGSGGANLAAGAGV